MKCEQNRKKKSNINFAIYLNLLRKYDEQFNYFSGKTTQIIVYEPYHSPVYIEYRDVRTYAQSTEYMTKLFKHRGAFGRDEIYHELKKWKEFYQEAMIIQCQHPMMFVTGNENTFKRRFRRLKRNIAADASSDDFSNVSSYNFYSFSTHGFLEVEQTPKIRTKYYQVRDESMSFDSSTHDIFEEKPEESSPKIKEKQQQSAQSDLGHLICDIRDVDYQKTLESYKIIQEKEAQNKMTNHATLNRLLKKEGLKEGASIPSKHFKNRIGVGESIPQNMRSKTKDTHYENADNSQATQKGGRKQKIRDKAAALLHRVQNKPYIDYSKYLSEKEKYDLESWANIP